MFDTAPRNEPEITCLAEAIESLPVNYRILADLATDRAQPEEDRADFLASLADTRLPGARFILEQAAKEETPDGPAAKSAAKALERFDRPRKGLTPEITTAPSLEELLGGLDNLFGPRK